MSLGFSLKQLILLCQFDTCAFLIVPEGVNRLFSDNNQGLYSILKWTLNGLLTEILRGYDSPVWSLEIATEFQHTQVMITTLQFHPADSNCEMHSDFIDIKYEKCSSQNWWEMMDVLLDGRHHVRLIILQKELLN